MKFRTHKYKCVNGIYIGAEYEAEWGEGVFTLKITADYTADTFYATITSPPLGWTRSYYTKGYKIQIGKRWLKRIKRNNETQV
jgi:hypothetical protein